MSTDYSEEELIEIENPDEIPNELYVKWMRLHYPLTQKRKRRVKQFSEGSFQDPRVVLTTKDITVMTQQLTNFR